MATDSKLQFAFQRKNYILLLSGLATIALGFVLMSGGGSADPNVFDADKLFSPMRITVAPLVVLIGFGVIGYAIMYKPKGGVSQTSRPAEPAPVNPPHQKKKK